MKKAILSVVTPLLLATIPAHATKLIETDNSELNVSGRAKFTLYNANDKDSTAGFSSRLGFNGSTENEDGLEVFFRTDWNMRSKSDSSDTDNITARSQFVGFTYKDTGTFTLGQTDVPFYTLLTGATDILVFGGFDASDGTYGTRYMPNLMLYSNTFGGLTVEASYQIKTEENETGKQSLDVFDGGLNSDKFKVQRNGYSAGAAYDTGVGVNIRGAFAYQEFQGGGDKIGYGAGLDYTKDNLYIAAIYTYNKQDDTDNSATRIGYEIAASYELDKLYIATGYAFGEQDSDLQEFDLNYAEAFKLGASYSLLDNVTLSAGWVNYSGEDNEYNASINYNF